ncbi:cation diffusion facilitator family transporter [Corynebacterium breve]|uniref:Cation diffusion facilitator family transporter n=1 Tax=Corynebacterium breve TaxID=3049799 RepID=A0ABY8VH74_9CORY|nr:cation diffusion facilitator family transporter [Corynebacterium breve]WIM68682.1 cation diffusion facilitator family transporter [Corynebacterium breve]
MGGHKHSHGHGHGHDHDHGIDVRTTPLRALVTALTITGVIFFAELIGGLVSGSLALLADAMHMLSDATGLIIAVIAVIVGKKAATVTATYGYRGVEALAAAVNALTVAGVSVWIVVEAILRLNSDETVKTHVMGIVAVVGLVANAVSAWVLSSQRKSSLNVEGAFLHVLTDMLGSVAVIIAAVVIHFTGFRAADTIASLLIAALVIPRAVQLLRSSLGVLLHQVPEGYDVVEIERSLQGIEEVDAVHDLHVWSTNGTEALATCHLVVEHRDCTAPVLDAAQARLREYGIDHSTIQIEHPGHQSHEHYC